jgi:glucokinase
VNTFLQPGPQAIQPTAMRKMNQLSLLSLIMEHGPISRTGLARLSRLSKPTVSAQVQSLIQKGLVSATGLGESGRRGGKKPTHLEFNAKYGCLAVGEIDSLETRLAVTDLKGTIITHTEFVTQTELGAESIIERLQQRLGKLLATSVGTEKLCLIAVAAPGRVDVDRGVVLEAGNIFDWKSVAVSDALASAFKAPVLVDNCVNLAALAEMNYGVAKGVDDFVLVHHDTGIGCGVVMGGRLHRGSNWCAGEIAHFIFDLNEARKDWMPRGYLEMQVGADRVCERARRAHALHELAPRSGNGSGELAALFRAWKRGHAPSRQIVDELVLQLGLAIAHVAATYDPSLIVLQGEIFPWLFEEIEPVVKRAVPWLPRLALSGLGKDAALRGAIVAAQAQAHEEIARAMSEGAVHLKKQDDRSNYQFSRLRFALGNVGSRAS